VDKNAIPIVLEETFSAPIDRVWKAIVDPGQMRQWFFHAMTDFAPEVGFVTKFNVHVEDRDYLHLWKVTHVTPGKRITYSWRYGGYPGESSVTWDLSETAEGTKLRLVHEGIETFPQDNPIFSREAGQAGWTYFVSRSLAEFLGRPNS